MNKGYNLGQFGIIDASAPLTVGRVGLANEGAFADTFLSQPLTQYAVNASEATKDLEALLDFIAPKVRVSRRFEYRKADGGDQLAMFADNADVRALYGEFATVKTIGDIVQAKTVSKGLSTVIEKDTELAGDLEAKVTWLKRMLIKTEIYRAYTLLASTAGTTVSKTWGNAAAPVADILAQLDAVGDAHGVNANRVLFGATAWQKYVGSVLSHAAGTIVPVDLKGLAAILGIDECRVSTERYTSGSGKSKVCTTDNVIVFCGQKMPSTEDPSTMKQFWSPVAGGGEWAVYVDEVTNPALKKITVCHNSQVAVTASGAAKKLAIA